MKNKIKLAILLLFSLNFLPGLFLINEGLFHCDSVILAQAVENTYKTGHLQPAVRGRYGSVLINAILYFPFFLAGDNADFTVRFSSVLFHSLSITVLFLFIYELFGDFFQAFFGALLFSFTPFYFSPNTYGKEHGASIFFLLLSFYLLCRGVKKRSSILIGVSGIIMALSISIKEATVITLPLFFLLYPSLAISLTAFNIKERFNLKLLSSLILPLLIVLCIMYFTYLKAEFYREIYTRDVASAAFLGLFAPTLKIAINDLFWAIPVFVMAFFIMGIVQMWYKKVYFVGVFLLLWFMLLLYLGNTASYGPRYLDIVIIPIYIFASYALSDLHKKNKLVSWIIVIYCVSSMFIFIYPVLKFRHNFNGEKEFALYVKARTENNAVIITMDDSPFIAYYGNRKCIGYSVDLDGHLKEIDVFVNKIKEYLKKGIPVFVMNSALDYDRLGLFRQVMLESFKVSFVGSKLTEDYHKSEIGLYSICGKLFKVELKQI